MAFQDIDASDSRYETLIKGFNLRFPDQGENPQRIYVCRNENDVHAALAEALTRQLRPTIRSGGHCYEGFVSNNEGGVIIDIGLCDQVEYDVTVEGHHYGFKMASGAQNWNSYVDLYKNTGKTYPGGSCYSVGGGGHICGGGFGYLSKLHGLSCDWVSAVDVLTVDSSRSVVQVHATADNAHKDLWRACRGAGGGNFGVITNYYFDSLPDAPRQIALLSIGISWAGMTREIFINLAKTFGQWCVDHAASSPETDGLWGSMRLTHQSSGQISISAFYCDRDGGLDDTAALNEFYQLFAPFNPTVETTYLPYESVPVVSSPTSTARQGDIGPLPPGARALDWLYAAQNNNGSGANQRSKYASSYMKQNFVDAELNAMYNALTDMSAGNELRQASVQVSNYGGAINNPARLADTAVPQRASVMKLQYQTYWTNPVNDDLHISWLDNLFSSVHQLTSSQGFEGTPYPYFPATSTQPSSYYEGCYINYPDIAMLKLNNPAPPNWQTLYYLNMYPFLQGVKTAYDPLNIFHHSMSITAP
ncbi:Aclacinomycin-N/aclacinomycin-A oxidase [Paraburkholderia nemoris]|uniref:FAD-dependent oxidoreductase n=1 Tax=Paraburkholderia nemoris TaxID=2793076 RepID=UPI0019092AB2|nr:MULTISPECIES: FAD-binding protein [Paraburkholderia]MBK3786387.1 FAD-binding oxidoreductase [Paraburkholderia aspalathi]CAE6855035.1 Aclacinomycin-N/aclacinomycin-A oxidase [Paraburkholderia nemoris]